MSQLVGACTGGVQGCFQDHANKFDHKVQFFLHNIFSLVIDQLKMGIEETAVLAVAVTMIGAEDSEINIPIHFRRFHKISKDSIRFEMKLEECR